MFLLNTAASYLTPTLLFAAATAACSPAPMPVSQSAWDPSNPAAAEAAPPRPMASATAAPTASAAAVYTCPMHSDVTSTSPGRCPKCGMNLVQKP